MPFNTEIYCLRNGKDKEVLDLKLCFFVGLELLITSVLLLMQNKQYVTSFLSLMYLLQQMGSRYNAMKPDTQSKRGILTIRIRIFMDIMEVGYHAG